MHPVHNHSVARFLARRYLRQKIEALSQELLTGVAEDTHSWRARRLSVEEAYEYIKPEFRGMPTICFEVAKRIVILRRKIDEVSAWYFFRAALDEQPSILMNHFNSRWIISVLDTVSDYAPPLESAKAEALKNYFLGIRYGYSMLYQRAGLAATERTFDNEDVERAENIWDGVNQFNYWGGDTFGNLADRLTVEGYPYLENAARHLHDSIAQHPVLGVPYQVNASLRRAMGLPELPNEKKRRRRKPPPPFR